MERKKNRAMQLSEHTCHLMSRPMTRPVPCNPAQDRPCRACGVSTGAAVSLAGLMGDGLKIESGKLPPTPSLKSLTGAAGTLADQGLGSKPGGVDVSATSGLPSQTAESGRSRVRIQLAPGFFRGRVMPGARRYRVSAGTGWPGVSIL